MLKSLAGTSLAHLGTVRRDVQNGQHLFDFKQRQLLLQWPRQSGFDLFGIERALLWILDFVIVPHHQFELSGKLHVVHVGVQTIELRAVFSC